MKTSVPWLGDPRKLSKTCWAIVAFSLLNVRVRTHWITGWLWNHMMTRNATLLFADSFCQCNGRSCGHEAQSSFWWHRLFAEFGWWRLHVRRCMHFIKIHSCLLLMVSLSTSISSPQIYVRYGDDNTANCLWNSWRFFAVWLHIGATFARCGSWLLPLSCLLAICNEFDNYNTGRASVWCRISKWWSKKNSNCIWMDMHVL